MGYLKFLTGLFDLKMGFIFKTLFLFANDS